MYCFMKLVKCDYKQFIIGTNVLAPLLLSALNNFHTGNDAKLL